MKTILVVDDEYALVETLSDVLREEGYHVVTANDGQAGQLRAEKEHPDSAIADFMMPIRDGLEMVLRLQAHPTLRSVPVVMMSAVDKKYILSTHPEGPTVKLAGFLEKPFQLDDVLSLIRRLIGKGEKQRV